MIDSHAGGSSEVEKPKLKLGLVPLTDCAPLVVALEKGFFARQGLEVELSCEASWANIRDKVALGALDGAQMLAAMPIAATLGLGALHRPMLTAFSLDLNGNAITVSNELFARMCAVDAHLAAQPVGSAKVLKAVVDADRAAGKPPLTFAMVYPFSTHNYQLRYWLAAGGIDPDYDVNLVVVPPPSMVSYLERGSIDGFCVGEPWNAFAVQRGAGRTLLTGYDIWNNGPEKVFGVTEHWAQTYPQTHRAVLRALLEAAQWLDMPEHRDQVVELLSRAGYTNAPSNVVRLSMEGTVRYDHHQAPQAMPDFNVFYRYAATFPWRSHAQWILTQMMRWGQADLASDIEQVARRVYRTDLYRDVAQDLGVAFPTVDWKTEGTHDGSWTLTNASSPITMGADRFLDGAVFDPADAKSYLQSFSISRMHDRGAGAA